MVVPTLIDGDIKLFQSGPVWNFLCVEALQTRGPAQASSALGRGTPKTARGCGLRASQEAKFVETEAHRARYSPQVGSDRLKLPRQACKCRPTTTST
jgi:hypothetical protein